MDELTPLEAGGDVESVQEVQDQTHHGPGPAVAAPAVHVDDVPLEYGPDHHVRQVKDAGVIDRAAVDDRAVDEAMVHVSSQQERDV